MSKFKRASISLLITLPAVLLLLVSPDWRHQLHAQGYYGYGYGVDLILDLVDFSEPVIAGSSFEINTQTTNNSTNLAEGVALVISLEPEFSAASISGCNNDPNGFPVCELGNLGAGEVRPVDLRLNVDPGASGDPQVGIFADAINTEDFPGDESIQFSPPLQQLTNTAVNIENGGDFVAADGVIGLEYLLTVSNLGFSDGSNAQVQFQPPLQFNGVFSWVCFAESDASCSPVGNNELFDSVDLDAGSSVIYVINGSIDVNEDGTLLSAASVSPADGINDPDLSNNTATDEDVIGLFADGYEDGGQPVVRETATRTATAGETSVNTVSAMLLRSVGKQPQIFTYLRDTNGRALAFWQIRRGDAGLQVRALLTGNREQRIAADTGWLTVDNNQVTITQRWGSLDSGGTGLVYRINNGPQASLALSDADNREASSVIAVSGSLSGSN